MGLRVGEVCKLHINNIDFDKLKVTIKSEKSGIPYINFNHVRNAFREVDQKVGVNQTYATSEEAYSTHRPRPLHGLTMHSLRHYYIMHFAESTHGDIALASRFSRHASPSTTMRYIAKDKVELYKNIALAFSDKIAPLKHYRRLFQEK